MVSIKSILKCHYYGLYEWLLVRFSAVLILLYVMYLFNFIFFESTLSYDKWHYFFSKKITKIFNIMALFSVLSHTWIGIRHILEDYIRLIILRKAGMCLTAIILVIYLLYGIIIIWSV